MLQEQRAKSGDDFWLDYLKVVGMTINYNHFTVITSPSPRHRHRVTVTA